MVSRSAIKGSLFGVAVGDALGVPVEFTSRESLRNDPVTTMRGFGSHDQPPGTWSDDSSLTFCLAESIAHGLTYTDLANRFINWAEYGYWAPHGIVFDIGIATRRAINQLGQGIQPTEAGLDGEYDNGNGSLMRILPLLFHVAEKPLDHRIQLINDVSSLTHRHIRSVMACVLYLEYARLLLTGKDKIEAYIALQKHTAQCLQIVNPPQKEVDLFRRLLTNNITELAEA